MEHKDRNAGKPQEQLKPGNLELLFYGLSSLHLSEHLSAS